MKTLKYISITATALAFVLSFNACTEGFEEINKNPNDLELKNLTPDYLFGTSPINTAMLMAGNSNWIVFGNFTQQLSVVGGTYPHYGRGGNEGEIWSKFYVDCIKPVVQLEKIYKDDKNYTNRVAIAKIWKYYLFSEAVSLWGDIPFSEAALGQETTAYEKDFDIYKQILDGLNTAANELKDGGDGYAEKSEPIFKSNVDKWRKFAHSIRLRVAMRVTEYEEPYGEGLAAMARQIVNEELSNNNIISNNKEDNCFITFGEATKEQNPFYRLITSATLTDADYGNVPMAHTSFMLWLKAYKDPRLSIFYEKSKTAFTKTDYIGRPSSFDRPKGINYESNPYEGDYSNKNLSQLTNEFKWITAKYHFITYPEICCIRAEAAQKGYWTGKSAEVCYYDAIESFSDRYSTNTSIDLKEYMNQPGIKWSTPADTVKKSKEFYDYNGISDCYLGDAQDNLKRIVLQHWIALFYQGMDSWTLLRRTQEIKLPPHWNADLNTAGVIPSADYKHAYIPQRLMYPNSQETLNTKNVKQAIANLKGGQDLMTTRLRWAKPVKTFEGPEYPNDGYPNTAIVKE